MIELNGIKYLTPKEIATEKIITNRKDNSDYGFVLRLIKNNVLKAQIFNEDSKIPYYLVAEAEIAKYKNRFSV